MCVLETVLIQLRKPHQAGGMEFWRVSLHTPLSIPVSDPRSTRTVDPERERLEDDS
jgi:hypothetical protein